MSRLTALLALALALAASAARAEPTLDEVTAAGRHWRFETTRGAVRIWVPEGYNPKTAATILFVHGYHVDVDQSWRTSQLAEQFALSGLDAMFIAAEAPSKHREAIVWPSSTALLAAVAARTDIAMPTQRVIAIGHSGAYRTLAAWLDDPHLDTVVLLDAAYADHGFSSWVRGAPHRRLINIASDTRWSSLALHRRLPETTYVDDLSAIPDARIIFAGTSAGHWQLVDDGIALPLALRAIGVARVGTAPLHLPLGVPKRRR